MQVVSNHGIIYIDGSTLASSAWMRGLARPEGPASDAIDGHRASSLAQGSCAQVTCNWYTKLAAAAYVTRITITAAGSQTSSKY